MCKEQKWRYRCGCHTTTIEPCRRKCFNDARPEIGLSSMPRDPGRPPCSFPSPSAMDDCLGWRRPTECLSPTAYVVDALVCRLGSYDWTDVMGSYESKLEESGETTESENSAPSRLLASRKSLLHGSLWKRPGRWRQMMVAVRK